MRLKYLIIISLLFFAILLTIIGGCRGLTLPQQEEAAYILKMTPITESLTGTLNNFTKAYNDYTRRDIRTSEYKEETRKLIEGINSCYDKFKEIKTPRRLEAYHAAFSEAMERYHNTAVHFQDFVDTDDKIEMSEHQIYAFFEMANADNDLEKANEEHQKYLGD